jgi:signal peptidase II
MRRNSSAAFWAVVVAVTAADVFTKWWAEAALRPQGFPRNVAGDWLRMTLVYNPGAAFGLSLGSPGLSRWIFIGLTLVALAVLSQLYQSTGDGDRRRVVALALVCAGAGGNLIDRIFRPGGVVDFIDIGIHTTRWPTFNVADMAVSVGAALLAWVLWDEDKRSPATAPGGGISAMTPAPVGVATDGVRAS